MKNIISYIAVLFIMSSCSKEQAPTYKAPVLALPTETFIEYNIPAGEHYCDKTAVKPVNFSQILFKVIFDSSAIYATSNPQNQYDINKLYGFTEGQDPHVNSARIGWSYNEGKLRLYAYAYNNQQRLSQEICPVNLNDTINCAIKVLNNQYVFSVGGHQVQLSRALPEPVVNGYQLYPYFGGDETAPHPIRVWIREF